MKILVLGAGLMGPAVVYNAMQDPDVTMVGLCDSNSTALYNAAGQLKFFNNGHKLAEFVTDLTNYNHTKQLFTGFDIIVGALPWKIAKQVVATAAAVGAMYVDLSIPEDRDSEGMAELKACITNTPVILGAGLEPGLTEILARSMAKDFKKVEECHIQCGGLTEAHVPGPLNYKIVYGGKQLPFRENDAEIVKDGKLQYVPRYSGVEEIEFDGVGPCEAWHEGFFPWLARHPEFKDLKHGTQKTVRWRGYAKTATLLKDLGMFSDTMKITGKMSRTPKEILDIVLADRVKFTKDDRDIVVVRVTMSGIELGDYRVKKSYEMVDKYDVKTGFTAMARTTGFTASIVARKLFKDGVPNGIYHVDELFTDAGYLTNELMSEGVTFKLRDLQSEAIPEPVS